MCRQVTSRRGETSIHVLTEDYVLAAKKVLVTQKKIRLTFELDDESCQSGPEVVGRIDRGYSRVKAHHSLKLHFRDFHTATGRKTVHF